MAGDSVVGTKGKAVELPAHDIKPIDYKVPQPEPFGGDRTKLKGFLVKCKLYFGYNHHKFKNEMDQVLWVVTLLKGPAFD